MKPINLGMIGGTGFARTHARTTDPGTSKTAAVNASRFAAGHFARIIDGLLWCPKTAKELALTTGLTVEQILRRTGDLEAAQAIRATGLIRAGCREFTLFSMRQSRANSSGIEA